MSKHDAFEARAQGMEESYFRTQDADMVSKLKKVFEIKRTKEEIKKASGITDDAVIDRLLKLNLSGDLLTVFRLYPLVEIAWADGSLEPAETQAVLSAATKIGIPRDSQIFAQLEEWLRRGPTADARAAWRLFASELKKTLSPAELTSFRTDLLKHARAVAESAGGILGVFFQTSSGEHKVLDEINKALT